MNLHLTPDCSLPREAENVARRELEPDVAKKAVEGPDEAAEGTGPSIEKERS